MSPTDQITVACQCGKRLKAPATAAGRKAKCPNCGNVLTIAAPPAAGPPPPRPAPSTSRTAPVAGRRLPFESIPDESQDDGDDANDPSALYGLADREAAAAAAAREAPPEDRSLCPKCMRVMPSGVVLCMNCGYDTRTGAVRTAARAATQASADVSASAAGSMVRGVALSAGLAVAASAVWIGVAVGTGGDWYLLAILIGVAAGVGMRKGLKDDSLQAGVIAGVVALAVSLAARAIVITMVLIPAENRRHLADFKAKQAARVEQEEKLKEQEIADRDPRVAHRLAKQDLASQGIDPEKDHEDEAVEKKIDAAERRAELKVRAMSRAEYEKLLPPIETENVRQTLIATMYEPQLRKMGLNPDFQRIYPEQSEAAEKAVLAAVATMTPQQQRDELKKVSPTYFDDVAAAKLRAKNQYTLAPPRPDELKPKQVGGAELVMSTLLKFWPIALSLLATAAAFRIASGALIA